MRRHAEDDTIQRLVALAAALDTRLADLDRRNAGSIQQRQRVAAEVECGHPPVYAT